MVHTLFFQDLIWVFMYLEVDIRQKNEIRLDMGSGDPGYSSWERI